MAGPRREIPVLILLIAGCAGGPGPSLPGRQPARESPTGRFTILAVNDLYRIEGLDGGAAGGLARVRTLRRRLEAAGEDVLVLHGGDLLYPSLLSRRYDGEQMIDVLNLLDGDPRSFDDRLFVTFGNHEFDNATLEHAEILDRRLEESQFTWLAANLRFASGDDALPLLAADSLRRTALITVGGVRVGLFGLTLDTIRAAYIESIAEPVAAAREATAALRHQGAEVVVALTHLEATRDLEILERLGEDGPDLILGGHEHNAQMWDREGRWVLKADSGARSATVTRVTVKPDGRVSADPELRVLRRRRPPPDPTIEARVRTWLDRHERETCLELGLPMACLDRPLGHTRVRLDGEELTIRRWESNLGNWVADIMLEAFAPQGAQAAFINSGSLRLYQNLPADTAITRRHLEELFAYPTELALLRLDAQTLRRVIERSVQNWQGNGWWLQVAGIAFRHDPAGETVTDLTLLTDSGPRPVRDDEELLVVTTDYLVEPEGDQDGYTMLSPDHIVAWQNEDLRTLIAAALVDAGGGGIEPRIEGRICNPLRSGPCLAVSR